MSDLLRYFQVFFFSFYGFTCVGELAPLMHSQLALKTQSNISQHHNNKSLASQIYFIADKLDDLM